MPTRPIPPEINPFNENDRGMDLKLVTNLHIRGSAMVMVWWSEKESLESTSKTQPSAPRMQTTPIKMPDCVEDNNNNIQTHTYASSDFEFELGFI